MPAFEVESIGSASDSDLFEIFEIVFGRMEVVVGDRELLQFW